ncbi:response regulator [Nitrosomonas sp.]|uniref:response regulator n=1 Tax=Nitrosomonas sp. TaxID=42353 RepID=UPI0025E1D5DA|nr:response regulator [Nitrosomonas sp.]
MILWIDDDLDNYLRAYLEELEDAGYSVIRANNADVAFVEIENNSDRIRCILMDAMLPIGTRLDKVDTEMGTATGLRLAEFCKDKYPNIPILLLTILQKPDIAQWSREKKIKYLVKQTTLPTQLVQILTEMNIPKI